MVVEVGIDDRGAAVPQLQGRGLLSGVRKAVNIDQLRRIVAVTDQQAERAEAEAILDGISLIDHLTYPEAGEIVAITLVTDDGGPLRSFRFEHCITARPELCHVRTRVRPPGSTVSVNAPSRA
ncbi:hypothetical protein [Arachnia propionica]|uniref:hypothetical protein n=1 Tax=Arachnia propionica TaxID=1750 RepID=UPI001F3AE776|nr:hypothetical protein [Arachnia propionica]